MLQLVCTEYRTSAERSQGFSGQYLVPSLEDVKKAPHGSSGGDGDPVIQIEKTQNNSAVHKRNLKFAGTLNKSVAYISAVHIIMDNGFDICHACHVKRIDLR